MPYITTFVLLATGVVLFVVLATRFVLDLRRFNQTKSMVVTNTNERVGLLRARTAGLRVALQQRRDAETTGHE